MSFLLSLLQAESMANQNEPVANRQNTEAGNGLIRLMFYPVFLVKRMVRGTGFEPVTPTVSR
jgi:hypothetical protein